MVCVRVLTDNDFNGRAVRGVLRRRPTFDLVRVQDVGLADASDEEILAWAAENDRIVISHDHNTMVGFARNRISDGEPMPRLFAIRTTASIGKVVDDLLYIDDCSRHEEWADRVEFLPY